MNDRSRFMKGGKDPVSQLTRGPEAYVAFAQRLGSPGKEVLKKMGL